MWGSRDDFHFVWKRMTGNFILSTRARFIGRRRGASQDRLDHSPLARYQQFARTAALHGDGLMSLQFRARPAGSRRKPSRRTASRMRMPSSSSNGAMASTSCRGAIRRYARHDATHGRLAPRYGLRGPVRVRAQAHVMERATFSNVRITIPAKRDFHPIAITSVRTSRFSTSRLGTRASCTSTRDRFRRPTDARREGTHLRAGGRLYRFDLSSRSPRDQHGVRDAQ